MKKNKNKIITKYFQDKGWTVEDACEELADIIKEYIKSNIEADSLNGKKVNRLDYIPLSFNIGKCVGSLDFPTIGIELTNEVTANYDSLEFIRFLYDYRVINREEYKSLEKKLTSIVNRTSQLIKEFKNKYPDEKKIGKNQRYFYDALYYYTKKYGIPISELEAIHDKKGGR